MRKAKREHRLRPFAAGLAASYITTLICAAVGAAFVLLTDSVTSLAGILSVAAMAISCFVGGHTAGRLRRHGGLAAGTLCGLLYMILPLLISLVTLNVRGMLLITKLLLCTAFGAAGGVVGVNSVK